MRDSVRLYSDMDRFTKRLRYYLKKRSLPEMEYIYCIEPQGRGAFHAHCILILETNAPFIENTEMARIWRYGFTKTKSLKNITNPGLYLTSYMSHLEFEQAVKVGETRGYEYKIVECAGEDGNPVSKAIVKGARLRLYPAGMRLFRVSKGIKRPIVTECTEGEAMEIVGDAPLTFQRTIRVKDDDEKTLNIINYRHYNKKVHK